MRKMGRAARLVTLVIFLLSLLTIAVGCQPQVMQHYKSGIALLNEGQYEQAFSEFSKVIELDPRHKEALNNRAILYTYEGEYDKALSDFNRVIELAPTFSQAFNNRGVMYAYIGEYDKAIADFNKAIELNPECVKASTNRRIVYQAQQKKIKTIADLEMCIELSPYPSQRTNNKTCGLLVIKRPPIVLVHGFQWREFGLDEIWVEMVKYLTGKDVHKDGDWEWVHDEKQAFDPAYSMKRVEGNCFVVYISNYTHNTSEGTQLDIRSYAQSLANEIKVIKNKEGVSKVDIVAHSMGGLVARAYIENEDLHNNPNKTEYENDVRKLIMLGTPNHGTYFAEFFHSLTHWESVGQMEVGSSFLLELNGGVTGKEKGVEYSAIAGKVYSCGPETTDPLAKLLCRLSGQKDNDGIVTVESVKLEKQGELDEIQESQWFLLDLIHFALTRLSSCPIVEDILISPFIGG